MSEIEIYREDLIRAGFRADFINTLNPYALCTLYELWDVTDEAEQTVNIEMFLDEYGFTREEAIE